MIKNKRSEYFTLFAIFLLALSLRLIGIRWGLPSDSLQHPPLMIDELGVMQGVAQLDFTKGIFYPEATSSEGPLVALCTALILSVFRAFGLLSLFEPTIFDSNFANNLLVGRCFVAILGSLAIFPLHFLAKKILEGKSSYITALIWAVFPFAVIYGHYLRTHIVSCVLVICTYWIMVIFPSRVRLAGVLIGLAISNRYSSALLVVFSGLRALTDFSQSTRARLRKLVLTNGFLIVTILILNHGIANLILGLRSQFPYVDSSQFTIQGLFRLDRILGGLTYLLPWAFTTPMALVILVFSIISLTIKPRIEIVLIASTSALFFFVMGKGYSQHQSYVRALSECYPGLIILASVGFVKLRELIPQRIYKVVVTDIPLIVAILSALFFDAWYLKSMKLEDNRVRAYNYLSSASCLTPVIYIGDDFNSIFLRSVLLRNPRIHFNETIDQTGERINECNFELKIAVDPIAQVEIYKNLKSDDVLFEHDPKIFGINYSYSTMPHDLRLPLATVLVRPIA